MTNELTAERLRELVARLSKKALYTDADFDNHSLGKLYREAVAAIIALIEREARMREALMDIAADAECFRFDSDADVFRFVDGVVEHTRAALQPETKETDDGQT